MHQEAEAAAPAAAADPPSAEAPLPELSVAVEAVALDEVSLDTPTGGPPAPAAEPAQEPAPAARASKLRRFSRRVSSMFSRSGARGPAASAAAPPPAPTPAAAFAAPGVSRSHAPDEVFQKNLGVSSERVAQAQALRRLGLSPEDVDATEHLFDAAPAPAAASDVDLVREMPTRPGEGVVRRARGLSAVERRLGYTDEQLKREKGLKRLGETEETLEEERAKQLAARGQFGRRRSYMPGSSSSLGAGAGAAPDAAVTRRASVMARLRERMPRKRASSTVQ